VYEHIHSETVNDHDLRYADLTTRLINETL